MGFIERPRRVVRPGQAAATAVTGTTRSVPGATPARISRDRLLPRSEEVRRAVRRLDAGLEPAACAQLADLLREEYASAHGDLPLGFVAQCHLGPPFVDHRLDLVHTILDHFAPGDPMPDPFGAARMLVRTGGYEYVEVYEGGLVLPVLADGTVVRP